MGIRHGHILENSVVPRHAIQVQRARFVSTERDQHLLPKQRTRAVERDQTDIAGHRHQRIVVHARHGHVAEAVPQAIRSRPARINVRLQHITACRDNRQRVTRRVHVAVDVEVADERAGRDLHVAVLDVAGGLADAGANRDVADGGGRRDPSTIQGAGYRYVLQRTSRRRDETARHAP